MLVYCWAGFVDEWQYKGVTTKRPQGALKYVSVFLCVFFVYFLIRDMQYRTIMLVRQLQELVGTNQVGQTYVVSFERYIHRHYRKS